MPDLGAPELMLILVIVLFVFGGSKVAEIGGSLGKGIKEFKNAMKEDEAAAAPSSPVALIKAGQTVCPKCSSANLESARFCNECGSPMAVTVTPGVTTTSGALT